MPQRGGTPTVRVSVPWQRWRPPEAPPIEDEPIEGGFDEFMVAPWSRSRIASIVACSMVPPPAPLVLISD
jgi:hypothetical protein